MGIQKVKNIKNIFGAEEKPPSEKREMLPEVITKRRNENKKEEIKLNAREQKSVRVKFVPRGLLQLEIKDQRYCL